MNEITVPDAPLPMRGVTLQGVPLPPGGAPDFEVAEIMERLSNMQTWVTLLMCKQVAGARDAFALIQDARCLIVERLYPSSRP